MHLGDLRSQININNIDKKYDKIDQINMIDEKESDGRNKIGENDEDRSTDDMEFLKQGTFCSKNYIYNIEK